MATATKKQPAEVQITPHTVVAELPLEKVIDNTLAKNNVTKKVLNAMKDKYLNKTEAGELALKDEFVLKNLTDKETYLAIKDERKGVRKIGILTEDLCKKGRADAIAIQKLWLGKEKEILDEVAIVQDKLDAQIKAFEDEKERLEKLEEERKDNQYNLRQTELIKMGAVFANGCLNINDLAIEISSIREADDEDYNETILPLFRLQYEKNEAARVAEQKKKDDEAALLKKQQEELAEQQAAFKKQQEEFEAKQAEAARIENEKKQQAEREEQQKKTLLQTLRLGLLLPVNPTGADVDMTTLWSLEEDKFHEILTAKKAEFKEKQESETLRLQEEAATKERLRIEEEQRQAQIKAQQEEQHRQEEAAKASDKDKWATLVNALSSITMPEFKSNIYKNKASQLVTKINEIKNL